MVSLVPGVNPETAGVVRAVHEPLLMTGRVMLSVTETYSLMTVPPPIATEPHEPLRDREVVHGLASGEGVCAYSGVICRFISAQSQYIGSARGAGGGFRIDVGQRRAVAGEGCRRNGVGSLSFSFSRLVEHSAPDCAGPWAFGRLRF